MEILIPIIKRMVICILFLKKQKIIKNDNEIL